MEELLRPVIELSYDWEGWERSAVCRIVYPGEMSSQLPEDFAQALALVSGSTLSSSALPHLKAALHAITKRFLTLDKSHQRLTHDYLEAQTALTDCANQNQAIVDLTKEAETLKQELITAKATISRLQSRLKERELRRSKAEILLSQAENRCKELVFSGTMLGNRVSNLEKIRKELENRINRAKESEEEAKKTVFQREDQIRKLLLRLKTLENSNEELKTSFKRRETGVFLTQPKVKETVSLPQPSESEVKTLQSRLLAKETELEVLKTMVKNLHMHPNSDPFRPGRRGQGRSPEPDSTVKLPEIRSSRGFLSPKLLSKGRVEDFEDFEAVDITVSKGN